MFSAFFPTEKEFIEKLKKHFRQVRMVKPPSSRQESSEIYAAAKGYNPESIKDDKELLKRLNTILEMDKWFTT